MNDPGSVDDRPVRALDRRTFLQTAFALPVVGAFGRSRSSQTAAALGAIVGRVVDIVTSRPIVGARIGVRFSPAASQTDRDGRFRLTLSPGRYEITCHATGFIGASRPGVNVVSGRSTNVDFRLLPTNADPTVLRQLAELVQPGSQIGLLAEAGSSRLQAMQAMPCTVRLRQPDGSDVTMELNEYLRGVVPAEMPASWGTNGGFEALKAQAVAARTYAVRAMVTKGFLWPDTRDQVWNPGSVNDVTDNAIAATGYEILTYGGSSITAYYSASCGGHGADGGTAYTLGHRDFLASPGATPERLNLASDEAAFGFWGPGQSPDAFCKNTSPTRYRWSVRWQRAELESTLDTYLAFVSQQSSGLVSPTYQSGDLGMLVGLTAVQRGNSGQIQRLRITGNKNGLVRSWDVTSQYGVRLVLRSPGGTLPLQSANVVFVFDRNPDGSIQAVTAYGGGYGHGIGLCQNGAYGMAQQGYSYREILGLYYPGAALDSSLANGCGVTLQSPPDGAAFIAGSTITLSWSGLADQYAVEVRDASGQAIFTTSYAPRTSVAISTAGWPISTYSWRVGAQTDAGPVMSATRQFTLFVPSVRVAFPLVQE